MEHANDCPAVDGVALERLAARLGGRLQFEAIAVEIEVAP
jgi:hypothetical protein